MVVLSVDVALLLLLSVGVLLSATVGVVLLLLLGVGVLLSATVGIVLLLLLGVGVLLSATVGVVLLVGVVSGAILPGSCSTSCSSPSSPSTLLLNELLGTWLALSITYRGLVTALFLIMAWIAPNHKTSGTLTSSSLSTLAPLLRSLSTTSLYHFFNALPCP